ncbi:MAG: trigger factor [Candidatus Levyibacteriota bacterium]
MKRRKGNGAEGVPSSAQHTLGIKIMISAIEKIEDGTIKLTITVPFLEVKKAREKVIENIAKNTDIKGFRKGKAPKKLVEEKVDEEKVREEILKILLPESYLNAVKEHDLKPIMNPKIQVTSLEKDKDWQFIAFTCELPNIDLGEYKENIGKITAKTKIIIPGKEAQKPHFEEIVTALLKSVSVKIPKILLDGEVERLLSQTLDEIKKLGLNLDQYLMSTGKTAETLRAEYEKKAENDLKFEFALQKIADIEKITVSEEEINEAIHKAKDENERKNLEKNRYLLAGILRQQKTLDFLKNL